MRDIGTGKVDRAIHGSCPECGFAVKLRWEDGTRVCVKGHRWQSDNAGEAVE